MIQDGFVFLPFSVDTWEMTATHFALGSCQRTCHEVPSDNQDGGWWDRRG